MIALLDEAGSPATMASAGPRFFGFVIGGARRWPWRPTGWPGVGSECRRCTTARRGGDLEQVALRWLVELFGLPPTRPRGFVTGATMANFSALAAARHAVLTQAGLERRRPTGSPGRRP